MTKTAASAVTPIDATPSSGNDTVQVLATIRRMRTHPGTDIPPEEEVHEIQSALLVFRCTACHGEAVLSQLVFLPPDERVRLLRTKVAMPGSGFRTDQVGERIEAFRFFARRSPS